MSRAVDTLPVPSSQKKMKWVVLSCSKTATLGLYNAFQILGHKPYHIAELFSQPDTTHMKIFEQAILAENNFLSGYRRLSRSDFDKWLADYNVIVEVASYIPRQILEAYIDDPDVRFLLTERNPDKWAASFDNFVSGVIATCGSFPLNVLKYFNHILWHVEYVNYLVYWLFTDKIMPGAPGRREVLRRNYVEYIRFIKGTVPAEKLTIIQMEDGLGWKQICDFTGDPVPDKPYPLGTEHEERVKAAFKQFMITGMINMAMVLVPFIGVGVGAWFNRALLW